MTKSKNLKTVKITIPNEAVLRKINSTPTFRRLSRNTLRVGENFETVNHKQFSDQLRLYPIAGAKIEDATEEVLNNMEAEAERIQGW